MAPTAISVTPSPSKSPRRVIDEPKQEFSLRGAVKPRRREEGGRGRFES